VDGQFSAAAWFRANCRFEFAGLPGSFALQLRRTPPRVVVMASFEGFLPVRQPVQELGREPCLPPAEHAPFFAGQRKLSTIVRLKDDNSRQGSVLLIVLTRTPPRPFARGRTIP
jgi:hypothetical protein